MIPILTLTLTLTLTPVLRHRLLAQAAGAAVTVTAVIHAARPGAPESERGQGVRRA